jgi:glycosyltransferase involved in cell wall biosynthesis
VPVIEVDRSSRNGSGITDVLSEEARRLGYPGVLYHPDPERIVDYDASVQTLRSSETYLAEAKLAARTREAPDVLVAIPAYNEAKSIAGVVETAREYADEVVVIDDGSTDDTVRVAEEAGATVIEHETNKGYGGALKTAFEEAARCHADHLVILDGDGQHDPSDVPKLISAQQHGDAEIVIGSRALEGSNSDVPLYRRFGLGVVNTLTNLSLGIVNPKSRIHDTQSGFRAYDRTAIETLAEADIGDNMSASIDILRHAHKRGYSISEVETDISYDVEEANSLHPVTHGIQLVSNLFTTLERDRPVTVLGIPGFVAILTGFGFGYVTLIRYLNTETFSLPLAVVATLLGTTGLLACLTAIVLHSLQTVLPRNEL